jgi:hypothetical protein
MCRPRLVVIALLVASALGVPAGLGTGSGSQSTTAASVQPRVTAIGDSVLTAILWYETARSILGDGIDLKMEVEVCRRLTGESCPFEGRRPPNVLQVVAASGPALGPTVIVAVGYSDPEETFAQAVEETVGALNRVGVTRILWPTYAERSERLAGMNRILRAAATRYRELTIVDWNAYSRDRWGWFQSDGIHLTVAGGVGLATMLHTAVVEALTEPTPLTIVSRSLPMGYAGRTFTARLRASGGRPPYTWQVVSGPLPERLHLRPNGLVHGTPVAPGRTRLVFRVTDAAGRSVARRLQLHVVRPAVDMRATVAA